MTQSGPWPNTLDLIATVTFLALVLLLPALGYVFMVLDIRAYLRSLERRLILAAQSLRGIPAWARYHTPRSVAALGLLMPCTEEELKRAYRQRVMQLHPDRGGDQRRFLLLQAHFEEALAIVTGRSGADASSCAGRSAA
ncbi:MAG: J domain-containing protein [Pirellulales bacterium]